ncbi:MAG: hypothetical protein DMG68_13700 [Acidobacteria bacterium]|nr:MAG: hypothetical protein DMG68_13700 [Acidobacteriota bacterium]
MYVCDGVGAPMLTMADADLELSACETAVTAKGLFAGTAEGGVYTPDVLIVPTVALPPAVPATCQVTCVLLVLFTVALN